MFKEPVEILPNVNYTACATLKVPCWGAGVEERIIMMVTAITTAEGLCLQSLWCNEVFTLRFSRPVV